MSISDGQTGTHLTHVEDLKDPIQVRLPTRNLILVVPRAKESRDAAPLTLFDDLLLDFRDGPVIESKISGRTRDVYRWFDSRRQLIYRLAHGLTEVVQLLSIHSPLKGSADIRTG